MNRRIAIYLSAADGAAGCAEQEQGLRAIATAAGDEVRHTLRAETAAAAPRARAAALSLAREGRIDAVLVASLVCWGEGLRDLAETLSALRRWDVSLIAARGFGMDLETQRGRIGVDLLAEIVDLEHAVRSARIRSGFEAARRPLDAAHARAVGVETRRQAAAMCEASKAGASYRAIAAEFGVSKNTVMRLVKLAGMLPIRGADLRSIVLMEPQNPDRITERTAGETPKPPYRAAPAARGLKQ